MKGNNLSKYLSIFIAIVAIVAAVLFIQVFLTDEDNLAEVNGAVSPLVLFSTALLYTSIGVTVLLSIWSMIKNPDNLKKTLLGVLILGVVLVVSYFFADSDAVVNAQGKVLEGGEANAVSNQWAGTGIWFSIALLAVAGAFFVIDLVKGLIKS